MLATPFSILVLSLLAVAAPAPTEERRQFPGSFRISRCSLKDVKLSLPTNTGNVSVPDGQSIKFVTVGVGVQNYTCGETGTFKSIGAVAELYDASCVASDTTALNSLPEFAFDTHELEPQFFGAINRTSLNLGVHTFVTNPVTNTGIVPRFDFRKSQKHGNAFVDCTKTGDIPAPSDPTDNVDWLKLSNLDGGLAKTVFRVSTFHGQPPASCTNGTSTSVNYAALYYFFS